MIRRQRPPRRLGQEEELTLPPQQTPQPQEDAPNQVWQTLQQSIGNAAVGRLRRTQDRALAEDPQQIDDDTQRQIDLQTRDGEPLPSAVRSELEPAVGPGLEDVRLHTDDASARIAAQLGKRAFTQGSDVYFAGGAFNPGTQRSRETLTHELTHVAQGNSERGAVLGESADDEDELLPKLEEQTEEQGEVATGTKAEELSGGKKRGRSKEDAVLRVPEHVEPKRCFVWFVNNKEGWDAIPGTGCAHWVAHEMNIKQGVHCDEGFSVRVTSVIAGKTSVAMADVQNGDIWKNPGDASHVGIVRQVNRDDTGVVSVEVEHDSSRQGAVVKSTFKTGLFFR